MSTCPDCEHDNIPGVDVCANCGQDLTGLDQPEERSELAASLLQEPVEVFRPRPVVTVAPESPLSEAVEKMAERHIGCVLVGSPEKIVGILSERDVLLRVGERYEEMAGTPVSELMSPDPETIEAEHPIAFALNRMELGDFRHLPVTRDGVLVGIVSLRDVLRLLANWYPDLLVFEDT